VSRVAHSAFFAFPHEWCPWCAQHEAFHPEACDIMPDEWREIADAVDAARGGHVGASIALIHWAARQRGER
jgi:hypothetical protein